jgi:predicted lipoprotein with Yx(FWY)xxD motif
MPGVVPTAGSFTLMVGTNSTLCNFLTDQSGRTLYTFVNDTPTSSACNGACASLWIPLIGSATAGSGVTASMIGVVTRQDGNDQVSYDGHPLYYFSKDVNAGDVNGQGYGNGKWWAISPTGAPISTMMSTPAMMSTSTP